MKMQGKKQYKGLIYKFRQKYEQNTKKISESEFLQDYISSDIQK